MKIDTSTLKRLAIELRVAVKEFVTKKQQGKLKVFAKAYTRKDMEFLLSLFDRYGNAVEYEKSGIRYVNGNEYGCFKFGYTSESAAADSNPAYVKARMTKLNTIKKVKPSDSLLTYPTTAKLIDALSILYAMRIFNTSFNEASMYIRVKRLKPVMDKISEQGITDQDQEILDDIFVDFSEEQRNRILELFDVTIPGIEFKGVRYLKLGKTRYFGVDNSGALCKFKYNVLNLRRTREILSVWKQIAE